MPRQIAFLLFWSFIVWLVRRDIRATPNVSKALWIPLAWMVIVASRTVKEWMYGIEEITTANADLDSSKIDQYVIVFFIIAGLVILFRRSTSWWSVIANNFAIALYFGYTIASMLWSDVPMTVVTFWLRMLEQLLMVLIVFTEENPVKAFQALFRRAGYILIPWSVLLIKYYPETGRLFSYWTGAAQNVGAANDKNKLGLICVVFLMFFLSCLMAEWKDKSPVGRINRRIYWAILGMAGWLLSICHSSNAQMCTLVGVFLVLVFQYRGVRLQFSMILVVVVPVLAVLLTTTDISSAVVGALGRDTTLTGRTELWAELRSMPINPLVGYGFESFWRGERYAALKRKFWWSPNEAHNSYLEMYINLGLVGMFVQFAMLGTCYVRARKALIETAPANGTPDPDEDASARFKMAFLLALILYGWAEATFKGYGTSFFLFMMISMEYVPQRAWETTRASFGAMRGQPVPQAVPASLLRSSGEKRSLIRHSGRL